MKIIPYEQLPGEVRQAYESGASYTLCPACKGGRTREVSLNIRQIDDLTVSLRCFRASCGWMARTAGVSKPYSPQFQPRPLEADVLPLSMSMQGWLASTYGVNPDVLIARGWRQLDERTLSIPLLDIYGRQTGHQTRTTTSPKVCRIYKTVDKPVLDVWVRDGNECVVIVEDSISAARLYCLGYNAVSILGTNITIEAAKEIALTAGDKTVILALDRDAFDKALHLSSKLRHIVRMTPVCLAEDIKDAEHDMDIVSLIDGVTRGRSKTNGSDSPRQAEL